MKTLAIYLPQYHKTKENDEWWGKDYTEWTAVQKADVMYEGHYQPREPLGDNYYNLLEKETMIRQIELAHKYKIGGFCFYHYYFQNGRRILEKPVENLLKWKELDVDYCFSWASISWVRSWSNVAGGSVASKFEKYNPDEPTVLLQQDYGGEEQWTKHFECLLPYFRDERYIKLEGKPVFLFHAPEDIGCLDAMVECWRNLAEREGFPGLYLIGVLKGRKEEYAMLDAVCAQEPQILLTDYLQYSDDTKRDICAKFVDYEEATIWSALRKYKTKQKMYYGVFAGYDNTPRHGKRGWIFADSTPERFERYFNEMYQRSLNAGNEFIFINAWNEWAEGNYLEPDKKFEYGYLKAVENVISGTATGNLLEEREKERKVFSDVLEENKRKAKKDQYDAEVMDRWLWLYSKNIKVSEFLKKNNYENVAIYGLGRLGQHLLDELRHEGLVPYVIDKRKKIAAGNIPVLHPQDKLPPVDLIVVTIIDEYEEIKAGLAAGNSGKIISLRELLEEIERII